MNKLNERKVIETDPSNQFKLEKEIEDLEEWKDKVVVKLQNCGDSPTATEKSKLYKAIEALNIDDEEDISLLHLVNCNRTEKRKLFWKSFDNLDTAFQYYFLCGCPSEMPHSFSERMIYEILEEEVEEDESLHCLRYPLTNRIKFEDLPFGRNLRKSQKRFKQYVQKRFSFTNAQTFESFIETGVPKIEYDYISVVFEVHQSHWDDHLKEYINWMMNTFVCPHEEVPKFLFFFIFYLEDVHKPEALNAQKRLQIETLKGLAEHPSSALFTPFPSVPVSDLRDWLRRIGERNYNKVEVLLDQLKHCLKKDEQRLLEESKLLRMKDVEEVQRMVYEIAHKH